MRIVVLVAALLASTALAVGQGSAEAKASACSAIADSLQRLTCFDRAFPKGSEPAALVTTSVGAPSAPAEDKLWEVEATRSAIDDTPKIIASLIPTSTSGSGVGSNLMIMFVRCIENTTSVVLGTDMFMVDETAAVTVRLDDASATTSRWERSSDYKALGLWNGSKAIPFVKQLASASRLVVRIQERNRLDAEFTLGNASETATDC